jgi:hypothetical protein
MPMKDSKNDVRFILSWFSNVFSRPSFRLFSTFIVGFIQLGKEAHTSSMVQSLAQSYLQRSLSSFTRFLGKSPWTAEDLVQIALQRFFRVLRIKARSILFLIADDTIIEKTGKKIPGCAWYKDHAQQMANVFGHQWVLGAVLCKEFLLPLTARLYHPKGTRGCGPFQTKIIMVKRMIESLQLPMPCKLYLLADSWYWAKALVQTCQSRGYHMISQLKSNSVILLQGQRTKVTQMQAILAVSKDKGATLYMSIRRRAFHVRKHILIENIKVTLRTMRIQFKQNILDAYLENLCP